MIGWVDENNVTDGIWSDIAQLAPEDRDAFLQAAFEQCVEFAPVLAVGDPVPARYPLAQVAAARDIWQASRSGDGETLGTADSGFVIRIRPLSTSVRALLRPRRAVPAVG